MIIRFGEAAALRKPEPDMYIRSKWRYKQGMAPTSFDRKMLSHVVGRALSGKGAHAAAAQIFTGVDADTAGARPMNVPHSLFELLKHILFWQEWVLKWLDGEHPPGPEHASGSWPASMAPANMKEWKRSVQQFQKCLKELERRSSETDLLAARGKQTPLEMLHAIASHNSYHFGQAVILRQILGKWPPRSGSLTW